MLARCPSTESAPGCVAEASASATPWATSSHDSARERAARRILARLPRSLVTWRCAMSVSEKPAISAATLNAILEAFNRHDLEGVLDFFAEECVLEMPRGRDPWDTASSAKTRSGTVWPVDSRVFPMCTTARTATGCVVTEASRNGC